MLRSPTIQQDRFASYRSGGARNERALRRMSNAMAALSVGIAAVAVACSSGSSAKACSSSEAYVAQAITRGSASEAYLGLGQASVAAIVSLNDREPPPGPLCTGVLVRDNWVLTAAHCLGAVPTLVDIRENADTVTSFVAIDVVSHPSLDVALLELDRPTPTGGASAVQPLALGGDTGGMDWVGQRVELAGYGHTETGERGELRFVVEPVVEVTDTKIRVDGLGYTGACDGDSGGPLLFRDIDGRPTVAGILSAGSASCIGRDAYIRGDIIAEWVASVTESPNSVFGACGTITEEGRCLYGTALRCVGEQLMAQHCAEPAVCGWDTEAQRFGCVLPENDSCEGVGSVGECEGAVARTCRSGHLQEADCGPCSCRYSPVHAGPECFEPALP